MNKLTILLLNFILLTTFSAKSIEIAAIAHDGRYTVIDLDTFEISNVGDLRRFGFIYVNDALPGSTYESSVIVAEFFKEPTEGGFDHSQLTLNKLTKLNHDHLNIPKGHTINYDEQYARIVAHDPQKRTILMSRADKKTALIYDENLKLIRQHKFDINHQNHNAAACVNKNGDIIMAGLYKSITFIDYDRQITKYDKKLTTKNMQNFGVLNISDGCYALMTSGVTKNQPDKIYRKVLNIKTNIAQKPFMTFGDGKYSLINNGQLLLQQQLNAIPIPNTPAFTMSPTEDFILYNTHTGQIVKQFKIPNQNATLKKVVKTDKGYIAILGGPKNIQFVSLGTFKSLKTIKLPFERFFVI